MAHSHRTLRRAAVALACAALVPAAAATAASKSAIKVSPKKPQVDDTLVVSFKAPRRLQAGWHYTASVDTSADGECQAERSEDTVGNPRRGRTVTIRVTPAGSDREDEAYERWCAGRAKVTVIAERDVVEEPEEEDEEGEGEGEGGEPSEAELADALAVASDLTVIGTKNIRIR